MGGHSGWQSVLASAQPANLPQRRAGSCGAHMLHTSHNLTHRQLEKGRKLALLRSTAFWNATAATAASAAAANAPRAGLAL